jgi:hypothetical protein
MLNYRGLCAQRPLFFAFDFEMIRWKLGVERHFFPQFLAEKVADLRRFFGLRSLCQTAVVYVKLPCSVSPQTTYLPSPYFINSLICSIALTAAFSWVKSIVNSTFSAETKTTL